ncbi:MAG: TSCPD domain-containing protein, partial [Ruminococcaceae bacterium]|nr:TSCPD domain-containing protein [Oscillospiraceae bacterium]
CPSQSESTARLVSIALRSGISVDEIYAQLKGIRCPSTVRVQGLNCTSCPDAIAKVIRKVAKFQQGQAPDVKSETRMKSQDKYSLSEEIKKKLNDNVSHSRAQLEKKVISKKPENVENSKPFDFSYSDRLERTNPNKSTGPNSDESKDDADSNLHDDFEYEEPAFSRRLCPDCSSFLEHEGGCVVCRNCGYSKCG